MHWISACSFNSVFGWRPETLWAAGVPGTFQVALCNQRKVRVQALGMNSRRLSSLIGSDGSEGADPDRWSCFSLWPRGFFSSGGRLHRRSFPSSPTCFEGVVCLFPARSRQLVCWINNPHSYERQTAVSTKEFGSQAVSPLLRAIAPLLIDQLMKSHSAPNQESQITALSFFFFDFNLGPSFFPAFFINCLRLCSSFSRRDLADLNVQWLDLNWPICIRLAGMETGSRCWHSRGNECQHLFCPITNLVPSDSILLHLKTVMGKQEVFEVLQLQLL